MRLFIRLTGRWLPDIDDVAAWAGTAVATNLAVAAAATASPLYNLLVFFIIDPFIGDVTLAAQTGWMVFNCPRLLDNTAQSYALQLTLLRTSMYCLFV